MVKNFGDSSTLRRAARPRACVAFDGQLFRVDRFHVTLSTEERRMNANFKSSRRIASAVLLGVILADCASGPTAPPADLLQRIESASTKGDHEALAAYYEREASAARASAATHRKIATTYQGMIGSGRGSASMPAHCNAIVREQEAIATEFEGMAAAHRQMGLQAKP